MAWKRGVAKVIGCSTMGMICTAGGQILVPDFIAWSWSGGNHTLTVTGLEPARSHQLKITEARKKRSRI